MTHLWTWIWIQRLKYDSGHLCYVCSQCWYHCRKGLGGFWPVKQVQPTWNCEPGGVVSTVPGWQRQCWLCPVAVSERSIIGFI